MILYKILWVLGLVLVIFLSINIEDVLKPNILILALGLICFVVGVGLLAVGYRFVKRDISNIDYYRSTEPIYEKLSRIAPGFISNSVGLIYLVLGIIILILQGIGFIRKG